jgi:hypothetical protein
MAVLFVAQLVPAHANDARPFWQGVMAVGLKQGRHEFAPHKVACTAKKTRSKAILLLSYIKIQFLM